MFPLNLTGQVLLVLQRNGETIWEWESCNTLQTALKKQLCYAMANGTFQTVDGFDIRIDGAWGNAIDATVEEGGDDSVNYVIWSNVYIASGVEVVSMLRLGVKSGSLLSKIYSEYDISDVAMNSGDYLHIRWTITAT